MHGKTKMPQQDSQQYPYINGQYINGVEYATRVHEGDEHAMRVHEGDEHAMGVHEGDTHAIMVQNMRAC